MRYYETIFIVHPNLNEEECREVQKKFSGLVERYKGVPIKVEEWGNQRLAYKVKKSDRGYFIVMGYCADPGLVPELERDLKLDDRVLKFQSVKVSDHADPNEMIQKQNEGKKQESAEAVAPVPEQAPEGEPAGEVKADV
jgi:small subunit ribosomal protein S6